MSVLSLSQFVASLEKGDLIANLRAGLVGKTAMTDGPFGPKPLIYCDYAASGRGLRQIEDYIIEHVLPFYSNSHTEASYCGRVMNRMRHEARAEIARVCGASDTCSVVFCGSGATSAINKLVFLFLGDRLARAKSAPLVLIGPYEHHSNILPWRESGAEVVEICEAADGGPDLEHLRRVLEAQAKTRAVIGAFSAASNVTGVMTDTNAVTRLLKKYGARAVWDFAGGGPYMKVDMACGTDAEKDAVVLSPHKFVGGPGASGVLIVRNGAAVVEAPSQPGGGTVSFVSPWRHSYSASLQVREESGTPNVIGDIRAALVLMIKDRARRLGRDEVAARHRRRALARWGANPRLQLLGADLRECAPIVSFRIRDGRGGYVHHQLFTRMLTDMYGVQARGGCACAGPYAHRLLGISEAESERIFSDIMAGHELNKPGWVRLNFSWLQTDEEADHVIAVVDHLAASAVELSDLYDADAASARFTAKPGARPEHLAAMAGAPAVPA
ncbi:MAG: aminotransferase class V-fold PLP-dependent enzyme [Parvularculaceae bacterium]|nr:aminotransferase class V-fold PLP-dependent enzyme [Parvularculaceae bacterium]